jgi:hypothetical protein
MRGIDAIGIAFFAFLLSCIALPAEANWQYTHWNMTRAQVLASAHGNAHPVVGKPGDRVFGADLGAEGTYAAAGIKFISQFYFDAAGRLQIVRLTPVNQSQCPSLANSLNSIYGNPVESSGITKFWRDAVNSNGIRITRLSANECYVVYTSLSSSGANGL